MSRGNFPPEFFKLSEELSWRKKLFTHQESVDVNKRVTEILDAIPYDRLLILKEVIS